MSSKIEYEKRIVALMVTLYCRKKHKTDGLCSDCSALLNYSQSRLTTCRYGETKISCKKCPTHCYNKTMRDEIRKVMRFSGARMILYHPVNAIRHLMSK